MDAKKNVLLLPCRHINMCYNCTMRQLENIGSCPVCREEITDHVRDVFV